MASTENIVRAQPSVADIEQAVALAARAPSIHNTQPWRFVLTADTLELWSDRRRQLDVADLDGRALLISCGGALHLAGLGLAALGWRTMTERLPDPEQPELLARIRFIGRRTANQRVLEMAEAAALRHTERRPFSPGPVPPELLSGLCAAVADPGVYVHCVRRPEERLNLAVAVSWADGLQAGNVEYQAELARWVRPDGSVDDGVPATAVPHVDPDHPRHTDVPVRDFGRAAPGGQDLAPPAGQDPAAPAGQDLAAPGGQDPAGDVDERPAYLVVFSRADDPTARLRAGETFAQLSVKAQQLGLASSAITQALDVPGVRSRLQVLMSWPDHPQMVLRVGWPPVGDEVPPTPRRPVATVLTVTRPDAPH